MVSSELQSLLFSLFGEKTISSLSISSTPIIISLYCVHIVEAGLCVWVGWGGGAIYMPKLRDYSWFPLSNYS